MEFENLVLVVAAGGTGRKVALAVERFLRRVLCGPDGKRLLRQRYFASRAYLPYQLPGAIQLVYFDTAEAELAHALEATVPSGHAAAAARTATVADGLRPVRPAFPQLAAHLRLRAHEHVPWMPAKGDPQVQVFRGAAQLPAVGRAVAFSSMVDEGSFRPLAGPIIAAFGRLAGATGDIAALSGQPPAGVVVVVVCSLAGGTGTGLWYDLSLVAARLAAKTFPALPLEVRPVLLLPSGFTPEQGGGRRAELNAAFGLADVDRLAGACSSGVVEGLEPVTYPGDEEVDPMEARVDAAVVVSPPEGLAGDDLHRSMASVVLDLAGARLDGSPDPERDASSHATRSVNDTDIRTARAATGVGRRSLVTALAARLTVPAAEATELESDRFFVALGELEHASPVEGNGELIKAHISHAGLTPLAEAKPLHLAPPELTGTKPSDLAAELSRWTESALQSDAELRRQLPSRIRDLARADLGAAAVVVVRESGIDLARAERVVCGSRRVQGALEQIGAMGWVRRQAQPAAAPSGYSTVAPPMPQLSAFKRRRARLESEAYAELLVGWHRGLAKRSWSEAWSATSPAWEPALMELTGRFSAITAAVHAAQGEAATCVPRHCSELMAPQRAVLFLLPHPGGDGTFQPLHEQLCHRLRRRLNLPPTAREPEIAAAAVGPAGWAEALDGGLRSPSAAVEAIQQRLREAIGAALCEPWGDEAPLLPTLARQLEAAGLSTGDGTEVAARELRATLGRLRPAGFVPAGEGGRLRARVAYPRTSDDRRAGEFITSALGLSSDSHWEVQLVPGDADDISVSLRRDNLGLTDIPEARKLARLALDAPSNPKEGDNLPWRQALGRRDGWLLTTRSDRARILHSWLNCLWEDRLEIVGAAESPIAVQFAPTNLAPDQAIRLDLVPFGDCSSWGSLLRQYVRFTVTDEAPVADLCARLLAYRPAGLDSGQVTPPSKAYRAFLAVAAGEAARLEALLASRPPGARLLARQLIEFWKVIVPEAMAWEFDGEPFYANHLALQQHFHLNAPAVVNSQAAAPAARGPNSRLAS